MTKKAKKQGLRVGIGIVVVVALFLFVSYSLLPGLFKTTYSAVVAKVKDVDDKTPEKPVPEPRKVTHIATPESVKAIYMTSWVAGTPSLRNNLIKLMDTTEINAVVIDIKDYSGKIAFKVNDPKLKEMGSEENRIADLDDLIEELHQKNIYIIGRISTFQDAYLVKKYPEYAVKKASNKDAVWADFKGISWIDASAKPAWDYLTAIGKESYSRGFDELNFDYIRFPSDGNMKDIYFPWSGTSTKPEALKAFFVHAHDTFKPLNIPISADLFGMVTTNTDDLGIGQVLENALPNFDFIAPMVYPSHYPQGWNNFAEPESHPYEVVHIAMKTAADRAVAMGLDPHKLRPWLQDFVLRVDHYGVAEVQAQIKAAYDSGLTGWMIWSASNKYTPGAFLPEQLPKINGQQ